MKPIVYYSQNREDIILSSFFSGEKEGFYVDVGAHHPVNDSVTKLFYEKGWTGINIEPQKELFSVLVKDRKRDINLPIGLSAKPGKLKLRSYEASGLSTFSNEQKRQYEGGNKLENTDKFVEYDVEVSTLENVLKKYRVNHVSFLKVDVEGYENQVLLGNNWDTYRPEVICIESNHILEDWRPLLKRNGYIFAFFDGLNDYYVSKESEWRIELFKKTFPEILVASPIISNGWHKILEVLEKQLEAVQQELDRQSSEREELVRQNNSLLEQNEELNYQLQNLVVLMKLFLRAVYRKLGLLIGRDKKP